MIACSTDGGSSSGETGDASTTATDPTTGGEICYAGHESCPCTPEGLCLTGLECLSNVCVVRPDGSSSGTPEPEESSGTTMALDGSTSSTAVSSEESGESSSGSGTTIIPPECEGETVQCVARGDTLQTCVDGSWVDTSCTDSCTAVGWSTGTCNPETELDCTCDGYADAECEAGMVTYCYCYAVFTGEECPASDQENLYLSCFDGTAPEVGCFASYYGAAIDCDAAVNGCL